MRVREASALAMALTLAACGAIRGEDSTGSSEQDVLAIDRLLIGQAATYPADPTLSSRAKVLEGNMAERRKAAWAIVEKVLTPVRIAAEAPNGAAAELTLPKFQTWYSKQDILPMFSRLFGELSDADKRAHAPFTKEAVDAVFPWNSTMATSLPTFTEERLRTRKQELRTAAGVASLAQDAVLMSPDYVGHLLHSYGKIVGTTPEDCAKLSDPNDFAPCLNGEFPVAAAAVKTSWRSSSEPIPTYDTSADALGQKLARGSFGSGDGLANPNASNAYEMQLADQTMHLVALHIMTKELRDWSWVTLWWSPDADTDFGADRPASITGVFAHYKMCVVTAFDEKDAAPGARFAAGQPTLAAALDRAASSGPSTWCSNPYLEREEHAATTNCIGCHQHGGTGETMGTILGAPTRFPDSSRTKLRTSFPSDYTFTIDGVLDLGAEIRNRTFNITAAL